MRRQQLQVSRAVRLAAQRHFGGLLPGGMRLIEQAMLLRRFPVRAKLRELVAIIAALLPDALQRLGGRMPAHNIPRQARQQQQAPATQIELAPESPDNVPARSNLQRSRAITTTTNRPRLPIAPALPRGIYPYFEADPFRFPRLPRNSQYLSAPFARKPRNSNLNIILVNFGVNGVNPTSDNALQCSSLGPYWERYFQLQPILGEDGKTLPVYQLRLDQFKLCEELLRSVAPGYSVTGAMMQYFGNGRVGIAITLQRQEPLDRGLVVATSSDHAATWNKVVLRDEKGGPARLIYSAGTSDVFELETGPSSINGPQNAKPAEVQFHPFDASNNVNAILAQAKPAAATPRQATETFVFNDCNTISDYEHHTAIPGPSSAPTLKTSNGPPPQDEAAPNATQTFEAGGSCDGGASSQDTPLDGPVRTRDEADNAIDGEGSIDGTPGSLEPEEPTHDMPTSPEPEQATQDVSSSPEPEQATHGEDSKEDIGGDSKKRKDRSPSPAIGHKRTFRLQKYQNDSEDDTSDSDEDGDNGNGGRGLANRSHVNSHSDSYGSVHARTQMQTEMPSRPRGASNDDTPAAVLVDNDALYDPLTESMRRWDLATPALQPSSSHANQNTLLRSAVQQSTPPTLNGDQHAQSERGVKEKYAGTRTLDEEYNDSDGNSGDKDGDNKDEDDEVEDDEVEDDEVEDDEVEDDEVEDDEVEDDEVEDDEVEDDEVGDGSNEDDEVADDDEDDDDEDDDDDDDGNRGAADRDMSQANHHTSLGRSQDETGSRPGATQSAVSEDADSDYAPDDSGYDASDSGFDSESDGSDFDLSDTEVQEIQSDQSVPVQSQSAPVHNEVQDNQPAPINSDVQDSESAPINIEDDENEDEPSPAYSGDDDGEIQLERRRADPDSRGADDEFESDDASDSASDGENNGPSQKDDANESSGAEESESDVVSSDDSDSEFAYSSESEAGIGSGNDSDELLGYKF